MKQTYSVQEVAINKQNMNKIIFENIVYCYYPKGINAIKEKEKYLDSNEFKKLFIVINTFKKQNLIIDLVGIDKITKNKLINITSFEHFDRSFNFKVNYNIDNLTHSVYIYISFLVPHFLILTKDKNNYKLNMEIKNLSISISTKLGLCQFPSDLINIVIQEISFQDIKEGEFTFFNAFFSDIKTSQI